MRVNAALVFNRFDIWQPCKHDDPITGNVGLLFNQ